MAKNEKIVNGAQALLKGLEKAGVEIIFGLPGGSPDISAKPLLYRLRVIFLATRTTCDYNVAQGSLGEQVKSGLQKRPDGIPLFQSADALY